jgi:hypothetical protein
MRLAALVALAMLVSACGSCRKTSTGEAANTATGESSGEPAPRASREAGPPRDRAMWDHAREGDVEDLTTLATHEGATGLVEAADEDAALRPTAIRAMAQARGWAQLPYLAKTASGSDDELAKLALASVVDLGARARRAEDPEDAEELRDGCEKLLALARDKERARARRVPAIRALRMLPCPAADGGIPTDLDAR